MCHLQADIQKVWDENWKTGADIPIDKNSFHFTSKLCYMHDSCVYEYMRTLCACLSIHYMICATEKRLYVWLIKQTWFTRIPYYKDRIRTTSSDHHRTFTTNIKTVEGFPTILSMKDNAIIKDISWLDRNKDRKRFCFPLYNVEKS